MTWARWSSLLALAVALAGCRREEPAPREPPAPPPHPFAEQACACADLLCLIEVDRRFRKTLGAQHPEPEALAAAEQGAAQIEACAAPLRRRALHELMTVTEAVCACQTRACYDALGDRRSVPLRLPDARDVPVAWAQQIAPVLVRFQDCDARLAALP